MFKRPSPVCGECKHWQRTVENKTRLIERGGCNKDKGYDKFTWSTTSACEHFERKGGS